MSETPGVDLVHSVSIATFNIDRGNSLLYKYPSFTQDDCLGYSDEDIANYSIPDGGHLYDYNMTYFILRRKKEDSYNDKDMDTLYGISYYYKLSDSSAKRGAVQNSVILILRSRQFPAFIPVLRKAVTYYADGKVKGDVLVRTLYEKVAESLANQSLQMHIFNEKILLNFQLNVHKEEFPNSSIAEVVKVFKENTMILYYSLLVGAKIMITAEKAEKASTLCVSLPLLVFPLYGFQNIIHPYISLYYTKDIESADHFIVGTANPLFQMKKIYGDVFASVSTGKVTDSGFKVTGRDASFIKNVISGVSENRSELWVREQFLEYTLSFISSTNLIMNIEALIQVPTTTLKSFTFSQKKVIENPQFLRENLKLDIDYFNKAKKARDLSAGEIVEKLRTAKDKELPPLLFKLSDKLRNLTNIDLVCEMGGVVLLSQLSQSRSAQVRKYAVNGLALIALTIKGQIYIIKTEGLIKKIVDLLSDKMSNVQKSASYCLMKISSLFVGSRILIENDFYHLIKLASFVVIDLETKTNCLNTLNNIYRYNPSLPILRSNLDEIRSDFRVSVDINFRTSAANLLDLSKQAFPSSEKSKIPRSDPVKFVIDGLQEVSKETEVGMNKPLELYRLVNDIDLIISVEKKSKSIHSAGALAAVDLLTEIIDTWYGRQMIKDRDIIEYLVQKSMSLSKEERESPYFFKVLRFLELVSEDKETYRSLLRVSYWNFCFDVIFEYIEKNRLYGFVQPALVIIKRLLEFDNVFVMKSLKKNDEPLHRLEEYFVHPQKRFYTIGFHNSEIQSTIWQILELSGIFDMDKVLERGDKRGDKYLKKIAAKKDKGDEEKERGRGRKESAKGHEDIIHSPLDNYNSLLKDLTMDEILPKLPEETTRKIQEFMDMVSKPYDKETGL